MRRQLWVQEKLRSGEFSLHKHPGSENPGDLLTKHVDATTLQSHCERAGLRFLSGRADSAPKPTERQGQTLKR